ncbi:MAG: 50S ribosomal protein L35 [Candidatus Moranbacteria bacterium]|nr:50S ribosomal protein L35 [Candidatus Moranbacteria bacterium]
MPKLKTRKAVSKRFKVSKGKKVIGRTTGQGHFNAREDGKATRAKRSDFVLFKADAENVKKNLPYAK